MTAIYSALVSHKHGHNIYTADDPELLEQVVYHRYVLEWWDQVRRLDDVDTPQDAREAIELYFQENEVEFIEFFDGQLWTEGDLQEVAV